MASQPPQTILIEESETVKIEFNQRDWEFKIQHQQ